MIGPDAPSPPARSAAVVEFFFVGPGKTGTSWLYEFVRRHGMCAVPSLKEPYIVDLPVEQQRERLRTLYETTERMSDFSNLYAGDPDNPGRIADHNTRAKIIITTRRPSARTASHFDYYLKTRGVQESFDEYLGRGDEHRMVERSAYRDIVARYQRQFPREQLLVLPLEQLESDPGLYVERLTDFLGVARVELQATDLDPVLARSRARSRLVARTAGRVARRMRRRGQVRLLAAAKSSSVVSRLLYRPEIRTAPFDFGPAADRMANLDQDYPDFVRRYCDYELKDT